MQFFTLKKSYKLRRKHQHNRRKYTLHFRHMSSSLGKHMGNSMFPTAFIHDRIFFSGIWRCLFWDEGHQDNSAKCVAPLMWELDGIAAWVISGSRWDSFHLTWDNITSPRMSKTLPQSGGTSTTRTAWPSLWRWEGKTRWAHSKCFGDNPLAREEENVFKFIEGKSRRKKQREEGII